MSDRKRASSLFELADEIDEITESILGATELIDSDLYGPWTEYRMSRSENRDEFIEKLKADSKFALHVLTIPALELAGDPKAMKFVIDEIYSGRIAEPKKWRQLLDKCLELHSMWRSDTTEYPNYIFGESREESSED